MNERWLDTAIAAEDPKQSKIVGKAGYCMVPKDQVTGGQKAEEGGWDWAIVKDSDYKEAAFLWIQWITNKENDALMFASQGVGPCRKSTYLNPPPGTPKNALPALRVTYESYPIVWPRPRIPEYFDLWSAMALGLNRYLVEDLDPQKAMDYIAKDFDEIMRKAGYY
jgi:multiple sugar transport system substrate-binding protein